MYFIEKPTIMALTNYQKKPYYTENNEHRLIV